MSRENVEVVRASFERFNRDGFLADEFFDPDIALSNVRESPIPGPYRGHQGLRKWRDDLLEVLEQARFEIEKLIDAGGADAVVTKVRLRGRARHTGIKVDFPFTIVSWMREGRILRTDGFSDHAEALEAADLTE